MLSSKNTTQTYFLVFTLQFVLSLFWLTPGLVLAKETKPADHFHALQSCFNCHPDGIDAAKLAQQNNNECLACHSIEQLQSKLNQVGSTSVAEPVPRSAKTNPPTLGMQHPLYYENSLLGDKPNEMILIPEGEFIRGTNERLPDEGPRHKKTTKAFYIDKYEVTNFQYKKFIDDTSRRSPRHFRNRTFPEGKVDHPVIYTSWTDAKDYCNWAGKRLPTDIEWEKAARGVDGREYPWGNKFDIKNANMPLRWERIGQFGDTTPVGSFKEGVSPYGLHDMTGNVWEWTSSWYDSYPGSTSKAESFGKRYKTLKGGSWFDCSFYKCGISAPVYNRAFFAIRTKNDSFGFRCAKDI